MAALEGKVALITGAAQGQGRSHALALAREGAAVALCDLAEPGETRAEVETLGGRGIAAAVDVRDSAGLQALAARTFEAFGRIDILLANAGIVGSRGWAWEVADEDWNRTLDVNLTGAWKAARAVIPHLIAGRKGGSIVFTGSGASAIAFPRAVPYTVSKHGLVGLMRTLAVELAPHNVRVNMVSPSVVNTPMVMNDETLSVWAGGKEHATVEDALPAFRRMNALPNLWVEPADVSDAIVFLVSDAGRYITGIDLPVDSGTRILPPTGPLPQLDAVR
jgi:(+)-trans-carveol dehydrogenase